MKKITFNNNGINPVLKNKKELKVLLRSIFLTENVDFKTVSYIFCKDEFLLKLNKKYLRHNTYTDIITFDLSGGLSPIISEIYISIERIRENSVILKVDYNQELHRVIIHGILHLCGFSDHNKREKKLMREKENFYLNKLGFT